MCRPTASKTGVATYGRPAHDSELLIMQQWRRWWEHVVNLLQKWQ